MSQAEWWLVKVREDLEHQEFPTTRTGVWCGVMDVNGIESVTACKAVSFETLEELLRPDDPELVQLWRKQRKATRAETRST